jgi:hypothetical protein
VCGGVLQAPDHPVLGFAVIGYSRFSSRTVRDIMNNAGCLVRWIVEDDAALVECAHHDIKEYMLEDVQVVPSTRYTPPPHTPYQTTHADT